MTGVLWALAAGSGFGLYQTFNRQAVRGMHLYVATFAQLFISALVLITVTLLTEDVSRLFHAPASALLYFVAAGFFHFLIGWTFLNASQQRIGAARTGPLIGTNPLFAAAIAAVTLGELPSWIELIAIVVMVVGAYLVSRESTTGESASGPVSFSQLLSASWLGLTAATCYAISPIFIRLGLQGLPSPLLGVTLGVTASALGYGVFLFWQRERWMSAPISGEAWLYKVIAGVLVGLSTWMRWVALGMAPVAVVLALSMVSAPVVIFLSPLVSGKQLERVTATLWAATAMIVGSALLLTFI